MGQACSSCCGDGEGEGAETGATAGDPSVNKRQSTGKKAFISGEANDSKKRLSMVRSIQRSSVAKKAPSGKRKKEKKVRIPATVSAAAFMKKRPTISSKPSKAKSKTTATASSSSTDAAFSFKTQTTTDCSRQTRKKKNKNPQQQKAKSCLGKKSKVISLKSSAATKSKAVDYKSKAPSQVILKSNFTDQTSQGSRASKQHRQLSTASSASSPPLHVQSVNELFSTTLAGAAAPGSLSSVISLEPTSRESTAAVEGQAAVQPEAVTFRDEIPLDTLEVLLSSDTAGNQLLADQTLPMTANGMKVNRSVVTRVHRMFSSQELEKMRANPALSADIKTVLYPPYSKADQIVPGLFLCGFAGTTKEGLQAAKISLLLNVTWELGLLRVHGLRSFRVPVDDSPDETISRYFNDVADLLEANRRSGGRSLVHCLAGVSRSATLVLAYLLKYSTFDLHQAFVHLHSIRPCIRPNIGFFRQLIEWELRLRGGAASTQLVTLYRSVQGTTGEVEQVAFQVPDFYAAEYPRLLEAECSKQVRLYVQQQQSE